MRILVIGDFHYPNRAKYPTEVFNFLKSQKFDLILCTGDLTDISILKELNKFGPVKIVQGNMDWDVQHPNRHIITIQGIKIGLIHGNQIRPRGNLKKLAEYAKKLDLNILISGHTHTQSIIKYINNLLLINPGSATGAWSFLADHIPSFIILKINEIEIKIINYQMIENRFESRKEIFRI